MGNAAGKEFDEKELIAVSLHEEGKNAFGKDVVTTEPLDLTGKLCWGGTKPGYQYMNAEKKPLFLTEAEGSLGRKGEILDGEKQVLATVRIVSSIVPCFEKLAPWWHHLAHFCALLSRITK